jgi:hypothetical protein
MKANVQIRNFCLDSEELGYLLSMAQIVCKMDVSDINSVLKFANMSNDAEILKNYASCFAEHVEKLFEEVKILSKDSRE